MAGVRSRSSKRRLISATRSDARLSYRSSRRAVALRALYGKSMSSPPRPGRRPAHGDQATVLRQNGFEHALPSATSTRSSSRPSPGDQDADGGGATLHERCGSGSTSSTSATASTARRAPPQELKHSSSPSAQPGELPPEAATAEVSTGPSASSWARRVGDLDEAVNTPSPHGDPCRAPGLRHLHGNE